MNFSEQNSFYFERVQRAHQRKLISNAEMKAHKEFPVTLTPANYFLIAAPIYDKLCLAEKLEIKKALFQADIYIRNKQKKAGAYVRPLLP